MQSLVAGQKEIGAYTQLQNCENAKDLDEFVGTLKRSGNVFRGNMYYAGASINEPVSMSQVKQKLAEIANQAPPSEHENITAAYYRINNKARTSIRGFARTLHSIAKIFHRRFGRATVVADDDISSSINDLSKRHKVQERNTGILKKCGFTDYHTPLQNRLNDIDAKLAKIEDELVELNYYDDEDISNIHQLEEEQSTLKNEKKQYDRTDYEANPWASPKYFVDVSKFKKQAISNGFERNKVFAFQTTSNEVSFAYIDHQGDFQELASFYKDDIEEGRIDIREQVEEVIREANPKYNEGLKVLDSNQKKLDEAFEDLEKIEASFEKKNHSLSKEIAKYRGVESKKLNKRRGSYRREYKEFYKKKSAHLKSQAELHKNREAVKKEFLSHFGWMGEFNVDEEVMFKP